MKKSSPPKKPHIHFVGVGGINMSALAQWFSGQNWSVSGSDVSVSPITQNAQKRGIRVKIPHRRGNIPPGTSLVIQTQAVQPQNPELQEAQMRHIPVLTNAEVTGRLSEQYDTIAVAGAHGKSTTTALAALVLRKAKLDPTVIIGTLLKEFGGNNFRAGRGNWLILEADEYARTFLHYTPRIAIITNVDAEHLDVYRNLAGVKKAFLQFIANIRLNGTLIVSRDDKNLYSLRTRIMRIAKRKSLTVRWYSLRVRRDAQLVRRALVIPGTHNVSNALAVLSLARHMRIPDRATLAVFRAYRGSWRRFEYRGVVKLKAKSYKLKALVYDDYAHHPTEIKATLAAFREKFPHSPLICVYQPHQIERLKRLWEEFQTAFDGADITLVLPVYRVAGRDKEHPKYNSRELVRVIQRKNSRQRIFYLENPKNLKKALTVLLGSESLKASAEGGSASGGKTYNLKPIIVMMGAGDIVQYTPLLLKK